MTDLTVTGTTGSDGIVPIYEPDARWTQWAKNQIYTGTVGTNRYVPKVGDYVTDTDTDERYKVTSLDPTTLVPTLTRIKPTQAVAEFSDTDLLLGVGPGTQSDTYRIYLDRSVMPHTLAVDARLKVNGSMVRTCVIYRGSELKGNQKAISAVYDQSGNPVGQKVPLELVAMANQQNLAVYCVPVCYTTEEMPDGEVVTAVFYSDTGGVVSKRQLLVENTSFIRSANAGVKYVTGISMESPFLSQTDSNLLQYPINVPIVGMNLMGVVNYSDGSVVKMPVDNTKFTLFGLENFAATVVGQRVSIVLKYLLSKDEIAYGPNATDQKFYTKTFRATTTKAEGIFAVKLYGFPVWVSPSSGYRMEWFLYNLDRQVAYKVTPYVRINENSRAFDPLSYGVSQKLSVSVNLKDVNPAFSNYIHVQTIDVVLLNAGTDAPTNWTVAFDPGQNPPFGRQNAARMKVVNQNLRTLKIDCGAANQAEWLDRLYYQTLPLVDEAREIKAPEPNFFKLVTGSFEIEYPISQWGTEKTLTTQVPILNENIYLKFIKRTPENDIQLAISAIPLKLAL